MLQHLAVLKYQAATVSVFVAKRAIFNDLHKCRKLTRKVTNYAHFLISPRNMYIFVQYLCTPMRMHDDWENQKMANIVRLCGVCG